MLSVGNCGRHKSIDVNVKGFVLTDGKTHYQTEDRGKTFDVPFEPALVGQPLSFHSDPKKYGHILYQGLHCVKQGWGYKCHDEASHSFYTLIVVLLGSSQIVRLTTQSKHFQTIPNFFVKILPDVNSLTVARPSSMKLTRISFIALVSTRHPLGNTIYLPAAFFPVSTSSRPKRSRILE